MRVAIGFATCGRAETLRAAVCQLAGQTLPPDAIVVAYTGPDDIAGLAATPQHDKLTMLLCAPGLPRQRNAILDHLPDFDVVLFLDDDFLVAPGYVEAVVAVMSANPEIVAVTGTPIADGVKGPGLTVAEGLALIAGAPGDADFGFDSAPHGYGCNMAINIPVARTHDVRFDERLPLYAWSEDVDFTHRLGRFGRIVKLRGARGVHLGVKQGRSPGRRLGYSQVANPIYLRAKGSYSWRRALGSVGRNLAANAVRALWPEPYIDRRGRLLGNGLAFVDLCRGRLRPERVLDF